MNIMDYIKPELMMVSIVLYFLGIWFKNSETVKDKYIPLINGVLGILICAIYVFATSTITSGQTMAMAMFTAITQGVLLAGVSTYVNELIKQGKKIE